MFIHKHQQEKISELNFALEHALVVNGVNPVSAMAIRMKINEIIEAYLEAALTQPKMRHESVDEILIDNT